MSRHQRRSEAPQLARAFQDPIGVLVADSNQMQSQLLVNALRRRKEFEVAACPLNLEAILSVIEFTKAQVAVLNLGHSKENLPDMTLLRRLHVASGINKVLLVDAYDRDFVVSAFRSGARGIFCFSEHPFRQMCKCIRCVHIGQIWANNEQLKYLIEEVTQVPSLRTVNAMGLRLLTPREEQVVALVADGLSNREAAQELGLTENTIKKYIFHIFDKLGISSRVELVLFAVSHGEHGKAEWVAGQQHASP
ncbi:MAG: LuxR C-terminal-related transcriptional regulator [Terriglobales bacterium]